MPCTVQASSYILMSIVTVSGFILELNESGLDTNAHCGWRSKGTGLCGPTVREPFW